MVLYWIYPLTGSRCYRVWREPRALFFELVAGGAGGGSLIENNDD